MAATTDPPGPGVYHYDPAGHQLTDLEHPRPTAGLRGLLGLEPDTALPPAVCLLSCRLRKCASKYERFAYRLAAVDVGVVLGRLLATAGERFGGTQIRVDFDDRRANAVCGLGGVGESVYALVSLGDGRAVPPDPAEGCERPGSADPPPVAERRPPRDLPAELVAMHGAACRTPGPDRSGRGEGGDESTGPTAEGSTAAVEPPDRGAPPHRHAGGRRHLLRRRSSGAQFSGEAVEAAALFRVLGRTRKAVEGLRRRCAGPPPARQVRLYCAVDRVRDVPPGYYEYGPDADDLVATGTPDPESPATRLQACLHAATVDLERSAFSVHVSTSGDVRTDPRGVRGYRVRQMAVGVAIEAATRAAAAEGLGSHPLHGFDAREVDRLYGIDQTPFRVEAQVAVGHDFSPGHLEGSVTAWP